MRFVQNIKEEVVLAPRKSAPWHARAHTLTRAHTHTPQRVLTAPRLGPYPRALLEGGVLELTQTRPPLGEVGRARG